MHFGKGRGWYQGGRQSRAPGRGGVRWPIDVGNGEWPGVIPQHEWLQPWTPLPPHLSIHKAVQERVNLCRQEAVHMTRPDPSWMGQAQRGCSCLPAHLHAKYFTYLQVRPALHDTTALALCTTSLSPLLKYLASSQSLLSTCLADKLPALQARHTGNQYYGVINAITGF